MKANVQKAQAAALKKAEADAVKVQAHDKATVVVDAGPTKRLPKVKQSPSTDDENSGESVAKKLLEKLGATKVSDLSK